MPMKILRHGVSDPAADHYPRILFTDPDLSKIEYFSTNTSCLPYARNVDTTSVSDPRRSAINPSIPTFLHHMIWAVFTRGRHFLTTDSNNFDWFLFAVIT
ncbi:MAG: hypothetical protein ACRDTG_23600 [Pseudonocardiaceae bacterium]